MFQIIFLDFTEHVQNCSRRNQKYRYWIDYKDTLKYTEINYRNKV